MTFEICVEGIDGVVAAQEGGGDRVELCASLGATIVIAYTSSGFGSDLMPIAAFVGALAAVALAYAVGRAGGAGRTVTSLVLGVASVLVSFSMFG